MLFQNAFFFAFGEGDYMRSVTFMCFVCTQQFLLQS